VGTQSVPLGTDELIEVLDVAGDLSVAGGNRAELQVEGNQVAIERGSGAVLVSCPGSLTLLVPRRARLLVRKVRGDASLQNLEGTIELEWIGGNAILRGVSGALQLGRGIGGELQLEDIAALSLRIAADRPDTPVAELIGRKIQHASRRVQARLRTAEEKASRHAQTWGQRSGRVSGKGNSADASSSATDAAGRGYEEERLSILRMLRQKKINADQADRLLRALDGNT
jgi:hypothetical protein